MVRMHNNNNNRIEGMMVIIIFDGYLDSKPKYKIKNTLSIIIFKINYYKYYNNRYILSKKCYDIKDLISNRFLPNKIFVSNQDNPNISMLVGVQKQKYL